MGDATGLLTAQDLANLKVCCLQACKMEKTTEAEMKTLLVLSDKLDLLIKLTNTEQPELQPGPPAQAESPEATS